jgi:hypothetical protein
MNAKPIIPSSMFDPPDAVAVHPCGDGCSTTHTSGERIYQTPTEDDVMRAVAQLWFALVLARPSDDPTMADYVLKALRLLGDQPPECFDMAAHQARMESLGEPLAKLPIQTDCACGKWDCEQCRWVSGRPITEST